MDSISISQVRRFNRLVTLRAGALQCSYLGRGRPLGEARLLHEIGSGETDLQRLRARLGLDSGYLSRLTKSLAAQDLVRLEEDRADRRRRRIRLTEKGMAEYRAYDALSDDIACSLLSPLNPGQRSRLLAAMADVERLMRAGSAMLAIEPAGSDDAQACLRSYFQELAARFDAGFDPALGVEAEPDGDFVVARLEGKPVGCGMLRRLSSDTGEIKRMWIAPEMRGLGLARRLITWLEDHAAQSGMSRIRLDTNRALTEAQILYRNAGYREIARYNDNPYADFWFEKILETAG